MSANTPMVQKNRIDSRWLSFWAVLFVIGLIIFVLQQTQALGVGAPSNIKTPISWGEYIAAFLTGVGAGSGLLLLSALPGLGFFPSLRSKKIELALLGLITIVVGGTILVSHLGSPLNLLNLVTSFRTTSFVYWDFWVLLLLVVVGAVYLWQLRSGKKELKVISWIMLLAAIIVLLVESMLLVSFTSRPLWANPMMPVHFLISGLLGGVSLAILFKTDHPEHSLRPWAIGMVIITLFLQLIEIVVALLSKEPRVVQEIQLLVANPYFMLGMLLYIAALVLLVGNYRGIYRVAAGLGLLAVFFQKLGILIAGQTVSAVLTTETYKWSWYSALIILAIVAIGIVAYRLLVPVVSKGQAE